MTTYPAATVVVVLICAALTGAVLFLGGVFIDSKLRPLLARLWGYFTEDDAAFALASAGRHAASADLPRPGSNVSATQQRLAGHDTGAVQPERSGHGPGPGQLDEWREDDDDTLALFTGINRERHDDDRWPGGQVRDEESARSPVDAPAYEAPQPPAFVTYSEGAPARFIPAIPLGDGVYVPNLGHDDTLTDLPPYLPHAGPPAWQPARPSPRVPCRDVPRTAWDAYVLTGVPEGLRYVVAALHGEFTVDEAAADIAYRTRHRALAA